jgi:hypothetical protein
MAPFIDRDSRVRRLQQVHLIVPDPAVHAPLMKKDDRGSLASEVASNGVLTDGHHYQVRPATREAITSNRRSQAPTYPPGEGWRQEPRSLPLGATSIDVDARLTSLDPPGDAGVDGRPAVRATQVNQPS